MADPQTTNLGLYAPTHGSDVDTWDQPLNANAQAIDSAFANVATITLTNAPVTLSTPPNSGATWAGPYQSQSALIRFTGTLTGNCVITFPRAGFFIVENKCTVGAFYVQLATSNGSGKKIGAPPGKKCYVFSDGTDMDYVDTPDVGTAYDLHGVTSLPAWMTACTTSPYLIKDGSVHNFSDFPALGALLGSAFGGNGITTFGLPDERARVRAGYDGGATNRLTTAISGVNGATMGSAGGDERVQTHDHGGSTGNDTPDHTHGYNSPNPGGGGPSGPNFLISTTPTQTSGANVRHTHPISPFGAGSSQNVQPTIVDCLPLIKT